MVSGRLLFIVNVDWFFLSHRLPIAQAALARGYEVHIATGLTDRLEELRSHGLIVHAMDLVRGDSRPTSTLTAFGQMIMIMRAIRPDVVHLVTIKPVLLGGIAARIARAPAVVAAVSGLGYVFLAEGFLARVRRSAIGLLYKAALRHRNSRVIFQNADDAAVIMAIAGIPRESMALIRGSGVQLDRFHSTPLPSGDPVVLLAARLLKDKGVCEFVAAARLLKLRLAGRGVHPRFVLVGEADLHNPASLTEAELESWRQEGVIELWGPRSDMDAVMVAATLVVLPSYREGLPKVLIEAAASARPVITTDVPGCRDAIEPGRTGLLVPPRDVVALAEAIESLVIDPRTCADMGRKGRELAERVFDVRSVVVQHLDIYEELQQGARQ